MLLLLFIIITVIIKVQSYVIFSDNVRRLQYSYVILPYVNRTLTSLYDENKICVLM